jgi:hypothetical protein
MLATGLFFCTRWGAMAKTTFIQASRRKSPAEKAVYHHVLGAGRSKVKRPFFDVTDAETEALRKRIEDGIDQQIAKTG